MAKKFRFRKLKSDGITLSKKEIAEGFTAQHYADFAKDAAPHLLETGSDLKTASPALRHALIKELKRIESNS